MKKIRNASIIAAFVLGTGAALAFDAPAKKTGLNVNAFDASTCPTTSVSVNCSQNMNQSCQIGGIDYKLKDASELCMVNLARN